MKIEEIIVEPGKDRIAQIRSAKLYSFFVSCTDMWTAAWISLGLFITSLPVIQPMMNPDRPPPPPGAALRVTAFIAGYWIITTPFVLPRLLSSFRIARRGLVVAGSIVGYSGPHETTIRIVYEYNGKQYSAYAGTVVDQLPPVSSRVPVAIDPLKPKLNRVIPNDFRIESFHIDHLREILEIEKVNI